MWKFQGYQFAGIENENGYSGVQMDRRVKKSALLFPMKDPLSSAYALVTPPSLSSLYIARLLDN